MSQLVRENFDINIGSKLIGLKILVKNRKLPRFAISAFFSFPMKILLHPQIPFEFTPKPLFPHFTL
jgi:hypothetical protein